MTPEEAADDAGAEYLLVPVSRYNPLAHLPHPENPDETRCDRVDSDRATRQLDPEQVSTDVCKVCSVGSDCYEPRKNDDPIANLLKDPDVTDWDDLREHRDLIADGGDSGAE